MKYTTFFLICTVLFSGLAFAEPKSLWCTYKDTKAAESTVADAPSKIKEYEATYRSLLAKGGPYVVIALDYASLIKAWKLALPMCSNAEWIRAKEFIFDSDGLKNKQQSNVEMTHTDFCGARVADVRKASMSSTPSIISFSWTDVESYGTFPYNFNIDRKTLKAGMGAKRPYKCVVRDIDTSANLI